MIKKLRLTVLFFLLICYCDCFSQQQTLEIIYTRFGRLKRFDIHTTEVLVYKLKGQHFYHHDQIANMQDSFIVFSNYNTITLDQLKSIRVDRGNYVIRKFQKFFMQGGIVFFLLNTINNKINHVHPALSEKAAIIAGGIVVTGALIREIGIKRVRLTKRKYLKIVDLSFTDLNKKPAAEKK